MESCPSGRIYNEKLISGIGWKFQIFHIKGLDEIIIHLSVKLIYWCIQFDIYPDYLIVIIGRSGPILSKIRQMYQIDSVPNLW